MPFLLNPFAFGIQNLDDHTADMAGLWSVRRRWLTSYTGSLIRVRRSSDDTEQDIGYDGANALDTAALLSFVGGGSGYVRTVYAQDGGAGDFEQSSNSLQPRIVNSGALETLSSRPCMTVTSNGQGFLPASIASYTGNELTAFARMDALRGSLNYERSIGVIPTGGADFGGSASASLGLREGGVIGSYRNGSIRAAISVPGSEFLMSSLWTSSGNEFSIGTASDADGYSASFSSITQALWMAQANADYQSEAGSKHVEWVLWTADKTAEMADIRQILST